MRKFVFLFAVAALVVLAGLWVNNEQAVAQGSAYRGAYGHLKLYGNNSGCIGGYSYHSGSTMQYSTDGGSHWTDYTTTGSGGAFTMDPYVSGFQGTMSVRAKPQCNDTLDSQNDTPCNTTSFPYTTQNNNYTPLSDNTAFTCALPGGPIH
jgi:hypothetical protein